MSEKKQLTFQAFIQWLAENKWPKYVFLHPLDYISLMFHMRPEQVNYEQVILFNAIVRPKPPIDRPEELDVSKERIWD